MSEILANINDFLDIDDIPDGIVVCDRDGIIRAANAAFLDLFGYDEDELIGRKIEVLIPNRYAGHAGKREKYAGNPVRRPMGVVQKIYGLRRDGTEVPVDICLKPAASGAYTICFARDISEHVRLTDEVRRMARHDPVTDTFNRRAFNEDLKSIIGDMDGCTKGICISLFDLDHFKDVNDTLGHSVGDELLNMFCARLREVMRETMNLYRIGGDEFALIMPNCPGRERGLAFVEALMARLQEPYRVGVHEISLSCSAGIVQAPADGESAEELISNADLALYKAKTDRGTFAEFTPELRRSLEDRFSLLSDLRTALENEQFELHFQPKVDVHTGITVGAEALLRWNHPDLGLLAPDRFIDIISESELSLPVGRWVLDEACSRAAEWMAATGRPLSIAVNLFPRQARSGSLYDDVNGALSGSGLKPKFLEIEITENTIIDSAPPFRDALTRLRDKGITIALDDFGTGYASLNSLTCFPINTIKIDKSFVRGIGQGIGNSAVLKAMAMMARELGLSAVAEGVETAEDALLVRHYGFDFAQGYYWGKPVRHADFSALLEQPAEQVPQTGGTVAPLPITYLEKILKHRFPRSA